MLNQAKLVATSLLFIVGCQGSGDSSAKPAGSAGAAAPAGAAPAKSDLVEVDLKPLPLQIKVPAGGMGAMDMSMGDKKSVTIDIGGGASLNIQETAEDFAAIKKSYQGDTVLFPFKKWAKEDPALAILQFENNGKAGYIGVALKDIGGKKYRCQTTGLDGQPSAEVAAKHLESCGNIAAK